MRKMDVNEKGSIHFFSYIYSFINEKTEKINEKIFQ